jgi:asparagine synthase (glutamine-hydrolysing)
MIKIQDEPIADSVCVPLYYVSKLAKENGVVVCQVGEGADELFFGYPNWQRILRLQKFSNSIFLKPFIFIAFNFLKKIGLTKDWRYEFLKRSTSSLPLFWGGAEFFNHNQKLDLLSERMKKKYKSSTSWEIIEPIYNNFLNMSKYKDTYAWMTYIDLNFRLPELLLMRVDKMTMANSIEARVPFLDHKFIEFIMSIPSNIKYKFNDLKYILKKSVKGIIPDEIINRKKQGFAAPIEDWFSEGLGNYSTSVIKEFCIETDLINYAEVEKLLNSNRKSYVWPILNAALWWKFYIKKQNI